MKINRAAILKPLGDTAVTIEFGDAIDRATSAAVVAAKRAVEATLTAGVLECVPTFRALAVHFDPSVIGFDALAALLGELTLAVEEDGNTGKVWEVPVVYDGPDLEEVARNSGLSLDECAKQHASASYHVYMLGFLPGFAYIGDLPPMLRMPRLKTPRTRVARGSVAIADQLTAIYPVESPGGWHLIGRTPLRLFDPTANPPNLFAPGDSVTFVRIGNAEFDRLARS